MSQTGLIDVTGMGDAEVRAIITPEMLEEGERTMGTAAMLEIELSKEEKHDRR